MLTQIPFSKLRLTDANVRRSHTKVDALMASIAAVGLLQPLAVRAADDDTFEIAAGGRRYRAIAGLILAGTLPEDHPVDAVVLAPGQSLQEAGLHENIIRQGMTAADEVRAFKGLVDDEGLTADEIAHRFGQTPLYVIQRLALANLHPTIFQALADGKMGLEIARTFTICPDQDRQFSVFKQFWNKKEGFQGNAHSVKYRLMEGAVPGTDSRALLIGAEAFTEAGGTVRTDLFAQDAAGSYFEPQSLLQELAEAAIIAEADRLREKEGLDFVKPFLSWRVPYSDSGVIVHGSRKPKEAEKGGAQVGKVLLLSQEGKLELSREYYFDRKPKLSKTSTDSGSTGSAGGDIKSLHTLGEKALRELAEQRRDLLRVALMRDPKRARLVMLFGLADKTREGYYHGHSPTGIQLEFGQFINEHTRMADFTANLPAAVEYQGFVDQLDKTWMTAGDVPPEKYDSGKYNAAANVFARLEAFLALPDEQHDLWASYLLCRSLYRTAHNFGDGSAFHDNLGQLLGIDVRAEWTPTAESYFGYPSKAQLLATLTIADEAAAKAGTKMKKGELNAFAEKLASDEGDPAFGKASKVMKAWVPKEMRFGQPAAPAKRKRGGKSRAELAAAITVKEQGEGGGGKADEPDAERPDQGAGQVETPTEVVSPEGGSQPEAAEPVADAA